MHTSTNNILLTQLLVSTSHGNVRPCLTKWWKRTSITYSDRIINNSWHAYQQSTLHCYKAGSKRPIWRAKAIGTLLCARWWQFTSDVRMTGERGACAGRRWLGDSVCSWRFGVAAVMKVGSTWWKPKKADAKMEDPMKLDWRKKRIRRRDVRGGGTYLWKRRIVRKSKCLYYKIDHAGVHTDIKRNENFYIVRWIMLSCTPISTTEKCTVFKSEMI